MTEIFLNIRWHAKFGTVIRWRQDIITVGLFEGMPRMLG